MAEEHLTTRTRQMWNLEEKFPTGPIKKNLTEIRVGMAHLSNVATTIYTLAGMWRDGEVETVRIAHDTLFSLACDIECNVDGVVDHLNQIFENGAPGGGVVMDKVEQAGVFKEVLAQFPGMEENISIIFQVIDVLSVKESLDQAMLQMFLLSLNPLHKQALSVDESRELHPEPEYSEAALSPKIEPAPPKPEPKERVRAISDYTPEAANAKISVLALWKHLEDLDAVSHDPAAVKAWSEKIFKEVQLCQVCK